MKRLLLLAFFSAAALCGMTAAADAQATRTWVSGVGDDANPCSRTAPCKTFAGAISKTAAGGEIDALDPAGFGTLTITKAITLDGGGGQVASVLAAGTVGFTVNAGTNDRVVIRNISINGISQSTSPGTSGINFINGYQLDVESCSIFAFSQYGINFQPATKGFLNVRNTVIESAGLDGIISSTTDTTGRNRITITGSAFYDNGSATTTGAAIAIGQNTRAQLSSSMIGGNVGDGVFANAAGGEININGSTIANNKTYGLHASNSGIIRVADSMISATNGTALFAESGGQLISFGNNRLSGNQLDGTFTSTLTQM